MVWFVSVIKPAVRNQTGPIRTIWSSFCVAEIEKPFQFQGKKYSRVFGREREMRNKMNAILKRGMKIAEDAICVKVIQSEIRHEISHPRFQGVETGSLGDFKLEWDSPESQDIVLRKQFDSGEEVVVSALLLQKPIVEADGTVFPREALAKVCIKKPGLSSILQFDCQVFEEVPGSSDFDIERAFFVRSLVSPPISTFGEDYFRRLDEAPLDDLDDNLQGALKEYLISKGISKGLTNFLVCHLNKKEQDQYVNWLRKLESTMSHSPKP